MGRWKQPSRMEMCPHSSQGLQEWNSLPSRSCTLELPSPKGVGFILARHVCTIFHSVPPKHCCCPAHFNVHGKLFSSRCSYLGLNNCLQLYEHHIKNANKGTKTINFCSIILWLTGAKKSKLAPRPAYTAFRGTVPLDFVFLNHPQSSGHH